MWEPWAQRDARRSAAHPRVRCKLSGLVTEAAPGVDDRRRCARYVDHLLDVLRPAAADVGQRLAGRRARRRLPALVRGDGGAAGRPADDDRAAILGGTARRFYGLD